MSKGTSSFLSFTYSHVVATDMGASHHPTIAIGTVVDLPLGVGISLDEDGSTGAHPVFMPTKGSIDELDGTTGVVDAGEEAGPQECL